MTTRTHLLPLAAAGLVLSVALAAGCDGIFGHHDLTNDPPPPPPPTPTEDHGIMPIRQQPDASAEDAPVRTCQAVMPDPSIDYVAMCRHYCDTLEETHRYVALSRGETPADAGSVSQQCYDLRCVPQCVDKALCLTQCDAANGYYGAVCATADAGADNAVCPSSPDDHLAACRAGCSPPPATIDLP
jgi:hypothetical protein